MRPDVLFPRILVINLIESFYLAIPHLLATIVVGDPLSRFQRTAEPTKSTEASMTSARRFCQTPGGAGDDRARRKSVVRSWFEPSR